MNFLWGSSAEKKPEINNDKLQALIKQQIEKLAAEGKVPIQSQEVVAKEKVQDRNIV